MAYKIYFAEHFKKQIKPYEKKYRNIHDDVVIALEAFDKRQAESLGGKTYKIRIRSSDIPRGKSNAFRMVISFIEIDGIIIPLVIYFKGDRDSVSQEEILYHKNIIEKELGIL